MTLLKRLGLILPASLFAATLLITGCSKSGTSAGLEEEDLDGDGIGNIYDPDMDGDGIADSKNANYCDQIQVFGLNEEDTTGSEIELTWKLTSSKTGGNCVVKKGVKADLIQVRASAVGAADTKSEKTNPLKNPRAKIQIPAACTGAFVEVTYDFTEIATLINADPKAAGWIVKQRHRADPERCDIDGDGAPDFGARCSLTDDNIEAAVDDYIDGGGKGEYKEGSAYANCGLIGTWDVSGVTNMEKLFKKTDFNEDISNWNVSNVTNMYEMFDSSEFNQPIGNWNVSNVEDMTFMFYGTKAFNQDISGWNVSNVRSMKGMFQESTVFNKPLNWGDKVRNVTDMENMFRSSNFNQDISGWNVSNVRSMKGMLQYSPFNQPLNWGDKVRNVTDMRYMFNHASAFNKPIGNWNVSKVTKMDSMFNGASTFDQDLSGWCVSEIWSKPTNFDNGSGFAGATANQPQWGTCPPDGEFVAASSDDLDADGIPNGSDPDVDGDGIPNTSDKDIDGDGIENKNDPDIDGDGIKNGIDNDSDGDGTPDAEDDTPGGPR